MSLRREDYFWYTPITTRWMDNDLYGHVNNVVYYAYFDTIANSFLIEEGGFDIHGASEIGYVVQSSCQYRKGVAFPQRLEGGFRVLKLGNSSVTYQLAIFVYGDSEAAAVGEFTHVFVDRDSERPVPIPATLRTALNGALASGEVV